MIKKIPIIIDCDTGIDDLLALTLLLASEKLDIRGVTTVAGNINVDYATYNTLNALDIMGRKEIPLAKGEAKPLERVLEDAALVHGETGIGTYKFEKETDKKPVAKKASDFIYEELMKGDDKIVILALAPLTNIAKLIMEHPDCIDKIDKIVFMGGSIHTGNPTPITTFNVLVDPEAAKIVLNSKIPFHMCPLNTTRKAFVKEEEIKAIGLMNNQVAQMAYEVSKSCIDLMLKNKIPDTRFEGFVIHDLCTAVYVTNPEYFTTKKYYGDVETKGEITTGFTMIDYENILGKSEEEKNITYVDSVNRDGVVKTFIEALKQYNN